MFAFMAWISCIGSFSIAFAAALGAIRFGDALLTLFFSLISAIAFFKLAEMEKKISCLEKDVKKLKCSSTTNEQAE